MSTKISELTELTTPASGDFIPIVDTSATTTKKIDYSNLVVGYTIPIISSGSNGTNSDATTYWFGAVQLGSSGASGGTNDATGISRIYVPKAGVLSVCRLLLTVQGTLASSETSTISIRVNDTTDYTVSDAVVANATINAISNTAMSITLAAGDFFSFKWVTPTWATNPTTVRISGIVYIQ